MNRAQFALTTAALAVWTTSATAPLNAQKPGEARDRRYRIAVARADGVVVPFAEHENGYWRPIWTGVDGGRTRELPMTLHDINARWWGKDGPALTWWLSQRPVVSEQMTVSAPRAVAVPCRADVGLATNYTAPTPLPEATVTPYPKVGLASTKPIDYAPIVPLAKDAAAWERVARAAAREFPRAEQEALREMAWGHPTPSRERVKAPLDLRVVWHVPGEPFYYYEAMRRYTEPETPDGAQPCDLVTYVAGYLWDNGTGELLTAGSSALISYCHLEAATFMWPLGSIREGARRYWVLQMAGWNAEAYSVVELMPARGEVRARLTHDAGVCPLR